MVPEYGMNLRPGKNKVQIELKLGSKTIDETNKFTYLGDIMNDKCNMNDQIKSIKQKTEGAYQTLIVVAEEREFKNIKMSAIWAQVNACIEPIITYI